MKHTAKTILFATVLLSSVLSVVSCDFLEQAPNNEQTKEYIFQDYLRSQRYVDLLYYNMPNTWVKDGKFSTSSTTRYGLMESATDMSEYSANYGVPNTTFNVGDWRATAATEELENVWYTCYRQVRRAWMFLENCDLEGSFVNEPEGRKPQMKGECHFMLAFNYFELLKRYGGVPIVKEVLSLDEDYRIPRSSFDEVAQFILDELTLAEGLLPEEWTTDEYGRATVAWCKALRSRLLLYMASPLNNPTNDVAKWAAAAVAAKECIDYCEEKGYHALSTDWPSIFLRTYPQANKELIIFNRTSTEASYNHTFLSKLVNYEQATPGEGFEGYGSNGPSQNFVDRFPIITFDGATAVGTEDFDWNNADHVNNIYKNRDPRFYYTVLYNGREWIQRDIETWHDGATYGKDIDPKNHLFTKTGYYLRKFWGRECKGKKNPGSCRVFGFFLRFTELYFNYAEAMNEAYGPDSDGDLGGMTAIEAINATRARLKCPASGATTDSWMVERKENPDFPVLPAGLPGLPTGMSKDEARARIQNERIIEFAFEDQYFYDILRWKRGEELIGGSIYGVDVIKSGETFTYSRMWVEDREFDSKRMYHYPIPQSEVYNLGIEQNPGW